MGVFFQGWRRKFGVATLLMACVWMAGWIRSLGWTDSFSVPCGLHADVSMISSDGVLIIYRRTLDDSLDSFLPYISTNPGAHPASDFLHLEKIVLAWSWKKLGFWIGQSEYLSQYKLMFLFGVVPYGSIVIPLTLIAAYLLLTKPRRSNQKKSHETIAVTEV